MGLNDNFRRLNNNLSEDMKKRQKEIELLENETLEKNKISAIKKQIDALVYERLEQLLKQNYDNAVQLITTTDYLTLFNSDILKNALKNNNVSTTVLNNLQYSELNLYTVNRSSKTAKQLIQLYKKNIAGTNIENFDFDINTDEYENEIYKILDGKTHKKNKQLLNTLTAIRTVCFSIVSVLIKILFAIVILPLWLFCIILGKTPKSK